MSILVKIFSPFFKLLDFFSPLGDLGARIWIGYIFLKAGLLKIQSWGSTLMLFSHEFSVPFLSPEAAAIIGTAAEIILPIMLFLGLGSRLAIVAFFIYNAVAVISYPHLWTPEGAQGLSHHISWGLLLALLMFHGPGKLSLDYIIFKKYKKTLKYR